jgi:hypothetical protein
MKLFNIYGKLGNRITMSRQYNNVLSVDGEVHYFSTKNKSGIDHIKMKDENSLFFIDPM